MLGSFAPLPARSKLKAIPLRRSPQQRETPEIEQPRERRQREAETQNSPLLKLPGEIRNLIYELGAIPCDQVFNTGGVGHLAITGIEQPEESQQKGNEDDEEDGEEHGDEVNDYDESDDCEDASEASKGSKGLAQECISIQRSQTYQAQFGLTQVCRQLRKETL